MPRFTFGKTPQGYTSSINGTFESTAVWSGIWLHMIPACLVDLFLPAVMLALVASIHALMAASEGVDARPAPGMTEWATGHFHRSLV